MFGNGVRFVARRRVNVHLHTARRGDSILPPSDLCTVRRSAVSAAFQDVCRTLSTFTSTAGRQHSLLLTRQVPRFRCKLSGRVLATPSSFAQIALGTLTTGSFFLLMKPPKANGASYTLGGVIRAFRYRTRARVLLLSCAGQTISRVYGTVSSVQPRISFVHINDRLSYSRTCQRRLVRGRLSLYAHHSRMTRHVTHYHVFMNAITSVSKGPRLFHLGEFSMTVVSRTARVLRPRLLNVLYTQDRDKRGTINGFVLVNSRGRLPTIMLRGARRSRVCSRNLHDTKLGGLGSSLFRHLCHALRASSRSLFPSSTSMSTPGRHSFSVLYGRKHVRPRMTRFTGRTFCRKHLLPIKLPRRVRSGRSIRQVIFLPSRPRPRNASTGIGRSRTQVITQVTTSICQRCNKAFSKVHALNVVAPCQDRVTLVEGRVIGVNVPRLGSVLISAMREFRNDRQSIVVCSFYIGCPCRLHFLSGLARRGKMFVSQGLGITLAETHGRVFVAKIPQLLRRGPVCSDLVGLVGRRRPLSWFYDP